MKRPWRMLPFLIAVLVLSGCVRPAARTTPAPRPGASPVVRVGLMVDTTAVEIVSDTGLELVEPDGDRRIAHIEPGRRVVITSTAQGQIAYSTDTGTPRQTRHQLISARPAGQGAIMIGGKSYRGTALVRVAGPGRVTAINSVDMENYLLGVVPFEIGKVGEELLEAAKAQAVAARTYAVRYMGRRESLGFDVFATVQDQVYGGVGGEHDPVSRAVRETQGMILSFDDDPIEAYYHSTCAGTTAAIHEVWPTASPLPYLVSIQDVNPTTGEAYCRTSNRFQWTERWPIAQFNEILGKTLADSVRSGSVGTLRNLQVLRRTPSGRVGALAIVTTTDSLVYGGDRIRWILQTPRGPILNSSKFDVQVNRDAAGMPVEVVATGGGWGHGIGMCQVGAMGRARAGQDYRTILTTYYPGASIRKLY